MDYAIIKLGGKQYRVRDGETLVVDRLAVEEGKTLSPDVLLGDSGVSVEATVVAHERGPKVRIGKYRRRTGYKRHTGFRAATSRVAISLASGGASAAASEAASEREDGDQRPSELPAGYEELTVAQIAEHSPRWDRPTLDAALAYEQQHSARKGALAALESALAAKEAD
jgi:large subunit ribosomal protein L21